MADDIFILGIKMTKFGKHPDLDTVDLAAEAAMAALADGGVTMKDMGILAAGNLMGAGAPSASMLQKQIGQTGIPVFNVSNACATGATALRTAIMAIKAGECDMGLAVGVEKLSGAGLLGAGGGGGKKGDKHVYEPNGPLRRRHRHRRAHRHPEHAGHLRPDRHGVRPQVRRHHPSSCSPRSARRTTAHSTLNPLAAYTKKMTLEEIMGDMMIAYPNTRPMCSANCDGAAAAVVVSGAKLKTLSKEQQKRAVKVSASILTSDPWQEACQVLPDVNTLTRSRPPSRPTSRPASARRTSTSSSSTTASPPPSSSTTTTSSSARRAAPSTSSTAALPWRDGKTPVNVSGGLQSKGHPIAATGIANIWEVCHHLRGEAGDRQIEGAKVGLAHVIGLGSACGVHILEKSAA